MKRFNWYFIVQIFLIAQIGTIASEASGTVAAISCMLLTSLTCGFVRLEQDKKREKEIDVETRNHNV